MKVYRSAIAELVVDVRGPGNVNISVAHIDHEAGSVISALSYTLDREETQALVEYLAGWGFRASKGVAP